MQKLKFEELPLSASVQKAIADMGFTEASPIQSEAIPYLLNGHDLIGQAQTGTGKTAAFGIPAVESIDPLDRSVQTLVLCPTRELAVQVSEEFKKLAKYNSDIRIAAIYGGESIERQIKALKHGVQIVVGTPGRVIDHIERHTLRLENVKMVILDEADEMLDMGFREDIEMILSRMPEERQTVFFSATMSKEIMTLTKRYQKEPVLVKIAKNELTTPNIEQLYYEVKGRQKVEAFTRLVEFYDIKLMLVFCNTKKMVDELVDELNAKGFAAEGLHGDMRQQSRNAVMTKFRSGHTTILVATDVAARGIDVDSVEAVFNYDLPMDDENYVHRIGRTGRAGKTGRAFTFVTYKDIPRLRDIQRFTKVDITKGTIPTAQEIVAGRQGRFTEKVKAEVNAGGFADYQAIIDQLVFDGFETRDIIGALIKMNMGTLEISDDMFKPEERTSRYERGDRDDRRGDRGGRFESRGRERGDREGGRFERGGDRGGRERGGRSQYSGENMVRLFINIGRQSNIRPGDIVGAIAGEANIPGNTIGNIDIFDKFSFVEIPQASVQQVLSVMDNNQIKGKKINIEIAK
ncbi:ATP-dependent RNA helicase DeaD [Flexibacter flexilis DSM 6793]|uniref:DEAD-box ATP-dependent RNA helicase RhpA n=1 Tax=Flexibacter flexilis DSM 6793 TaxID=927664 RepID=A0A1I1DUI9_9BACT|nr:DEAD/DEAH box helicase [Flexibacter flexilis]SFB78514.1 ATP-dependent RNA helicase DeaD [Flexibacter flexilis DSM 6793]